MERDPTVRAPGRRGPRATTRRVPRRPAGRRVRLLTAAWVACGALAAPALPAQEPEPDLDRLELPRAVADEVVAFFNDPATIRFTGRSTVPAGSRIVGDVAVLGGPLALRGTVEGRVMVVNGDLRLGPDALVDGDVTVVGGAILDREAGEIRGAVAVYDQALRYRERGGRITVRGDDPDRRGLRWGDARLTIRSAGAYNRVEGLPVLFGPTFRSAEPDPLVFEALALWRTEAGLTLDEDHLGYSVRAEQRFGGLPRLAVGASAFSRVEPIAGWGLTSLESSLASFFLHRDHYDHYEREGWSAWIRGTLDAVPLSLRLELRDEDHAFAPVSSPWTLRRNDEPWRPQPLVGEGDVQSLRAELVWDSRNDPDDPADGWLAVVRLTRGLDGELRTPLALGAGGTGPVLSRTVDTDFTAGFADLRRYNRVTPSSTLSLRVLLGGSVDGSAVPPQFQHALGGEGSLPGYQLFEGDCGARSRTVIVERSAFDDDADPRQAAFPSYGCDRVALFQLEYRSVFDVSIDLGPDGEDDWDADWDWYPAVDFSPAWSVFLNAGQGWTESPDGVDTGRLTDVGAGLFLGDIGLYWAYPLEGGDRDPNFFIRLERRF